MSNSSTERRAAKVTIVNGLSTALSIGFQLVSVPICLKYWGKESYGSWLALYASFMLVRSLDTGFTVYVGNKLNYLYHQDQQALREHLASSIIGIVIISIFQLSIGLSAVFSDRIVLLLGLNLNTGIDHYVNFAFFMLIGTWALSGSYLGIVHRLLIPAGLMYQAAWWAMGFQVSQFSGIILAAMLHFNMLQASVLFAFIQFVIYGASAIYIRIKLPAYYPWWWHGNWRTGIKDLKYSLLLTISNIIQQGVSNGTVVLISALSGAAAIPVFSTVRTLANLWTNVTNILTFPWLPEVVRFHATGEGRKLVAISEVYWVIVGSTVNLGVLITYPLIEPLYGYWTAHSVILNKPLLCLLLASVVVTNVGGLITVYLNGINSLGIMLASSTIRAMSCLSFGMVFFFNLGFISFGVGILVGELLVLLLISFYFVKYALPKHGVDMTWLSFAPIAISTASVMMVLVNENFYFISVGYAYSIAFFGVLFGSILGWKLLEVELKIRLLQVVGGFFVKKTNI